MPQKVVTLQDVEAMRDVSPKRRRFSDHPVVYERTDGRFIVSTHFSSIDRLFEEETSIETIGGPYGPYRYLDDDQFLEALDWQSRRENLIFLRDMLDCSVALDFNLAEAGRYTELGLAEHNAKETRDAAALKLLSDRCSKVAMDLSLYKNSEVICAVPPSPGKDWDLPTQIVAQVAKQTGLNDISSSVAFKKPKKSVKTLSLADKWGALEDGSLCLTKDVKGKKVILLDDKYQSGTTAQFVAAKLYDAGAAEISGLFCIKTWRDTDNT